MQILRLTILLLIIGIFTVTCQDNQINNIKKVKCRRDSTKIGLNSKTKRREQSRTLKNIWCTSKTHICPKMEGKNNDKSVTLKCSTYHKNPENWFVKTFQIFDITPEEFVLREKRDTNQLTEEESKHDRQSKIVPASKYLQKMKYNERTLNNFRNSQNDFDIKQECKKWKLFGNKDRLILKCSQCKPAPDFCEKSELLMKQNLKLILHVKFLQINEPEISKKLDIKSLLF